MNSQDKARFTRLAAALAICGTVASQIPQRPAVALAGDGYRLAPGRAFQQGETSTVKIATVAGVTTGAISAAGHVGTVRIGRSPLLSKSAPIYDITQSLPDEFEQVAKILSNAERATAYRIAGPNTVFWPTDEALTKALGTDGIARLQSPEGKAEAQAFLDRLTVAGSYSLSRLEALAVAGSTLTTLSGDTLVFKSTDGKLTANGVELLGNEHPASNGFVLTTGGLIAVEKHG